MAVVGDQVAAGARAGDMAVPVDGRAVARAGARAGGPVVAGAAQFNVRARAIKKTSVRRTELVVFSSCSSFRTRQVTAYTGTRGPLIIAAFSFAVVAARFSECGKSVWSVDSVSLCHRAT